MLLNDLPIMMLICLIITIISELVVAMIIKIRDKKDLLNIILVNCMTNPIVVSFPIYFYVVYGSMERKLCLVILEIFTVITEGIVYKKYFKFKKINPFTISLILNFSSYIIGEMIDNIFFWR